MIGLTGGDAAKQNLRFLPPAHAGDAQKTSDNLPINIHGILLKNWPGFPGQFTKTGRL
jgi:hypothetical protein